MPSAWREPRTRYPLFLSGFILGVTASGLACGVRTLPWWFQLAVVLCCLLSITCLFATNVTDPGVIKPAVNKDPVIEQLELDNPNIPNRDEYYRDSNGVWVHCTYVNNISSAEKYCTTCNVWRPLRGHHCNVCNHCVDRFDHHCGVVGACVAKGNHRFFALLLLAAQAGTGLLTAGSAWRLQRAGLTDGDAWNHPETYFILGLAVFYGYLTIMLLFGQMHCLSIIFDITTKDCVRRGEVSTNPPCCPGRRSPCNLVRSWREVCCGPIRWRPDPSSYNRLPSRLGEEGGRWATPMQAV